MNELNTTFTEPSKNSRVNLYVNPFNKENGYYGRIAREIISFPTIAAHIHKQNTGMSELTLQNAATLIKAEVLDSLRSGKAVNLLDLGIMYLSPNGKFKGKTVDNDKKQAFSVKFTPSKAVQDAVSDVGSKEIQIPETGPVIESVTNQFTQKTDGTVSAGKTVLFSGERLKVEGEDSGIFLCPVDENENLVPNEDEWLKCEIVTRNVQKYVEFYVNAKARPEKKYKFLLRTYHSHGKTPSKNAKEVVSETVTVLEP